MRRLEGKVAIVTGGGGGIGSAVARRFVSEGARVAIADLFEDSAKAAAEPLGEAALAVQFDAADPASIEALVEATVAHFGGLDILHNNAAMTDPAKHPLGQHRGRYPARYLGRDHRHQPAGATCWGANTRSRR